MARVERSRRAPARRSSISVWAAPPTTRPCSVPSPALDPAQLRSRLLSYAVGPATSYGAGLVNAYNSLTASNGPVPKLFARLYAAINLTPVQTVEAEANGGFTFSAVQDGTYQVYA